MGMTDDEKKRLKGSGAGAFVTEVATEPFAVRLPEAERLTGLSRAELYRRASRGQIDFVKAGASTLVVYRSLRDHIASLPKADIRLADAPATP
jgi:hypothetical protein